MRVAILTMATLLVASSVSAAPFSDAAKDTDTSAALISLEPREDLSKLKSDYPVIDVEGFEKGRFSMGPGPEVKRPEPTSPTIDVNDFEKGKFPNGVGPDIQNVDGLPPKKKEKDGWSRQGELRAGLGIGLTAGIVTFGVGLCLFKFCKFAKDLPVGAASGPKTGQDVLSTGTAKTAEELGGLTTVETTKQQKKLSNFSRLTKWLRKPKKQNEVPPPYFPRESLQRRQIFWVKDV